MVNRMRATSSKTRSRRSHHKVANPTLSTDEKGTMHVRHRVSPTSGIYKGRQVLDVDKKVMKKAAKLAAMTPEATKEKKQENKKEK